MHRDEEKGASPVVKDGYGAPARPAGASFFARWLDASLRIITLFGTVAALILILESNQRKALYPVQVITPNGPATVLVPNGHAKWKYSDGFTYLLAANVAVAFYSLILTLVTFFNKRGSLLLFILDFIAASILLSAASTATAVAYLGERGNAHANWPSICGSSKFNSFCMRIAGALLATFIAWCALALSTILAAYRLRYRS